MTAGTSVASELAIYACPLCKHLLRQEEDVLRCLACSQAYPIREGIPDFILEELSRSSDAVLRRMAVIDRMARIYGTRLWYPIVLNVYGGFHSPSLAELVSRVSQNVQSAKGRVLDIACGPGTFGRRIATPSKEVFGIDISGRMLRQGAAYAAKEGTPNVHFARAGVEALPFEGDLFDAALCCGSLHLFADTVIALREMARVMKPAATLSVFTFVAGRGGVLKFRRVREWRIDFQNRQRPMFRISRGDDGFDADSIDQAREGVRSLPPGRYRVDKIRADPFPSGHTSRAWGHLIRDFDGSVVDEPHRWPERTSIG